MLLSKSSGDVVAIVAALNKSQAVIEFKLDGTILTANENFLEGVGLHARGDQGPSSLACSSSRRYKDSAEYRDFWAKL